MRQKKPSLRVHSKGTKDKTYPETNRWNKQASERDVIAVKYRPRLSPCTLFGHPCICSWKATVSTTKSLTCARGKRRLYLSRRRRWLAGSVIDHPPPPSISTPPHTATHTPLPPTYAHTQFHGHSQQHAAQKGRRRRRQTRRSQSRGRARGLSRSFAWAWTSVRTRQGPTRRKIKASPTPHTGKSHHASAMYLVP